MNKNFYVNKTNVFLDPGYHRTVKGSILKFLAFGFILVLSCTSCKKENLETTDYFLFGVFHGECMGDKCVQTYKLTDNALYLDQTKKYPDRTTYFKGDFVKMENKYFRNVQISASDIPQELLATESGKIFGCPDCTDGGGTFIEYKSGNTHKFWVLDNMKYQVPEYLHAFMDKVHADITKINE